MFPSQPSTESALPSGVQRALHRHWRTFLGEGILLSLLGLAAIILPPLAGLVATVLLGWLFLVAGIAGLIFTIRAKQAPGYWWSLFSALMAVGAGGVLLWDPLTSLVTLTYVLIVYFIVDGLLMIILGFAHRRELSGKWEWIMFNGVVDLVLAVIVIAGLPGTLVWVLGLLVGIDMLFGGASLIAMALEARKPVAP
ncbi:MAG TPA: HdeD family acid-resistance protein [Aliidongia sp.]|nr:HdeD family acid-resistance protein [Aliidongia sp.]